MILELAHQELLQRPRYIAECWAPVVATVKTHECFYSLKKMMELYSDLKPFLKKVILALKATLKEVTKGHFGHANLKLEPCHFKDSKCWRWWLSRRRFG